MDDDLEMLRKIASSGGREYTTGNVDRSRYQRLVDLGWLTPHATNLSDVEYKVTEKGFAVIRSSAG